MKQDPMSRLDEIAEEVVNLLGNPDIFEFINCDKFINSSNLDRRLQEVMQDRHRYESIELAMYLRISAQFRYNLPSWQPLLNASIEVVKMRGENAEDLFYGMMPPRQHPQRNTGLQITQKR